jgi:hypothetical protein
MSKRAASSKSLPPPSRILAWLGARTGPATVSEFAYRFTHVPTAALRAYLRRLAASGVLYESRDDSDTLQFSLPPAVTGLDALYRPTLPTRYTARRINGVMGRQE